ncbi:MAG: DUF1266 domain-containing protein [bacterium]
MSKIATGILAFVLLFCGILFLSCERRPTDEQKLWALAAAGVLAEVNGDRHDLLAGCEPTLEELEEQKLSLVRWWGIETREDLFSSLQWIEQSGHRKHFDEMGSYLPTIARTEEQYNKMIAQIEDPELINEWNVVLRNWHYLGKKSLIGWDYSRYIHLCRRGYLLGLINEKEAWDFIMPVAQLLQQTFDSWEDLGENYLIGREFWSYARTKENGWYFLKAHERLLADSTSPWVTIPWDLKLD